jgi:hypothetical protein
MEGPRRKKWSPEISSAFWVAYSALCDLLKPVTIDTIEASRSKIKAHKFIFFGPLRTISLTQRTARRYLILLLVLLVISTVSGFIVSVSNSLSTEIKALVGDGDTYVTQTAAGLSSIEVDLDELANANENPLQISLEDTRIKPEVRTKIDGLRSRLQDLYYVQDRMHQKVTLIFRITSLSVLPIPQEGDLSRLPVLENGFDNVRSAAFVALTPATTALLGIPVLGEWPSAVDWTAIALISLGVYVVSGGPLPAPRVRARVSTQ